MGVTLTKIVIVSSSFEKMKKILFLSGMALLLAACNYGKTPTAVVSPSESPTAAATTTVPVAVPTKKTVTLTEENKSGQKGTAVLEEVGGKVKVTVSLTGTKMAAAQPAHIHIGICPGVGAVKYPLTNVVSGSSVTMLDVTMADLVAGGPLALNVHKSANEAGVYTACGGL